MGFLPSTTAPVRNYAPVYNVQKNYGAAGNAKSLADGAITSSTQTFTSATANFTAADVGKAIYVTGAGAAGAQLVTTISAFTNSTTVTLTASAGTTVSGAQFVYGADDTTPLQNAINDANTAGGGKVYLPFGNYLVTSTLTPLNTVAVVGAGIDQSIIYPIALNAAFKSLLSSSTPLTDAYFVDFTIDGINQAGSYNVSAKGFYIQYLKRCVFERLYIKNTGATGLGCDFYLDSLVHNVIAESCGRLGNSGSAGAAGIGVGTNSTFGGSTRFVNCITRNNATNGIFFESQNNTLCQGYSVINHFSEGNGTNGIADAGCDGLQVIGGVSRNNTAQGFTVYGGTIGGSAAVTNTQVIGLTAYGNKYGLLYDTNGTGVCNISGCKFFSNTQSGIQIKPNSSSGHDQTDMTITNCEVFSNAHAGIWLGNTSGGSGQDRFVILGNRIYNNGSSANDQHGIDIHSNMTDGMIAYNRMFDDQGASQTQTYGFLIKTGCTVSGNMVIKNNDMRGNKTGAYLNQGNALGGAVVFRDNPGVSDIVTKSSAYTITPADHIVIATGTTTITLPDATLCLNAQYTIKSNDATNTITVATTSSQTIDGATTLTFAATRYEGVTVQSDGSNWWVVNQVATSIL